ncbi:MAG: XRE family transcriptional regulator [Longispora sp.]|nr:XRE family transcriptional regulator [Longispora sp. (in: high G+C Gram-positive bacteria)]
MIEQSYLAERLAHLIDTVHPRGRKYSDKEIAATIREEQGGTISSTYIWQLRTGRADNPSMRQIESLARFFGVPVSYFTGSEEQLVAKVDAELAELAKLRDSGVHRLALRASDLDDRGIAHLNQLVETLRDMQGLPSELPPQLDH